MNKNIVPHKLSVTAEMREKIKNQKGMVLWFTGISGSGKSSIANALDLKLNQAGFHSYILDGDNIRSGLNSDLGFSPEDRSENIRRMSEVAALFADAGLIVLTSFISPFEADRTAARRRVQAGRFIEIFVECPLKTAEERDPKGLYKRARNGELKNFTGVDSPYEAPENPELIIDTAKTSVSEAVEAVFNGIQKYLEI